MAAPASPAKPDRVARPDLGARVEGAARAAGRKLADAERAAVLEVLAQALADGREAARGKLQGQGGGLAAARTLAETADQVISALFDFASGRVFRAGNPTQGERLALLAVGGYGRGLMAPYSDVDLLFLRPYKTTPRTESVIEFMLYALWDLGFKVGHASRTVDECLKLARDDSTIRTAMVDARLLAGDARLARQLQKRFRAEVARGTGAAFVEAKLRERDARHANAGASRYLVEPNVKEGKGALRDLNTLFWIAQYLHPVEQVDGVVRLKAFDKREFASLQRASDFLWTIRCHLHFTAGRAEERLSFDLQPETARLMGYGDRGDAPAVERFMRRYFTTTKEVGALTRAFCAKLEAEQALSAPTGLSRFWPVRRRQRKALAERGFHEEGGRLNVEGQDTFRKDPVNLIRLFRLSDRLDLDLHPDAVTAVHRSLRLITPAVRRDPEAVKAFLDILARGKRTYRTLTLMNESGVLGSFIPEFGRVVGQMQFNMYHAYTVDEHTLRAVEVIADIAGGRLKEVHPLSVQAMPLIADQEALFLAMLLHDTGKGKAEGQEEGGAKTARAACMRLGLEPERVELVAWLVRRHLLMSDVAQKRDVRDPQTVGNFAQIVKSPERLRMLLVLTVADIRAVGPGVWNGWKGQLMRELYTATESVFRGGHGLAFEEPAARARARLGELDPAAGAYAESMDEDYLAGFDIDELAGHAALVGLAGREGGGAAAAKVGAERNATEVVVAARDRLGLFADLVTVLAGLGAEVVGARASTSRTGQALDVFHVQDATGAPLGLVRPERLNRVLGALRAAARGEGVKLETRKALDAGRAAAFTIAPVVVVDNDASMESTVVEASGRDRPGLLATLARAISRTGLSIQSAHIDNYGARAVDVFYVRGESGGKLDEGESARLKSALTEVLSHPEQPSPARPRLQRARASAVR
jgi:[protein-PII] uridylyltransferase